MRLETAPFLRALCGVAFAAATLAASTAVHAQTRARVSPLKVKLSARDQARLTRKADTIDRIVRSGHTPSVDLHIAEASEQAGITWRKVEGGYPTATVFEISGVDRAGGELHLVMTAPASGHVMQPKYGGRPFSVVEGYAHNDIIHLTHKAPGASQSEPVLRLQSRGLVTTEGFTVDVHEKGPHTFWYSRGGAGESATEGSEPGLRKVTFIVK